MPLQFKNIAVGNLQDDVSGNNYAANKAVYILNLNNTLAQIFSDEAGTTPIVQDGVNNVTGARGVFGFWVEAGDYFVQVGANKYRVSITGADYFNNRIDETIDIIVDSVAGRGAYYVVGSFEAGFTYTDINQVGTFGGTDYYIYTGGLTNLPHNVNAGTNPTLSSDYAQVFYGEIDNVQGLRDELNDRALYLTLAEAQSKTDLVAGQCMRLTDRDYGLFKVLPVGVIATGWGKIGLTSGLVLQVVNIGGKVNVKHYGAVGDGVVDDTAPIQEAINDAVVEVEFPIGTYSCSKLNILTGKVKALRISGAGREHTTILSREVNDQSLNIENTNSISGVVLEDITIDGDNKASSVYMYRLTNVVLDRVAIKNHVSRNALINRAYQVDIRSSIFTLDNATATSALSIETNAVTVSGECYFNTQSNCPAILIDENEFGDLLSIKILGNVFENVTRALKIADNANSGGITFDENYLELVDVNNIGMEINGGRHESVSFRKNRCNELATPLKIAAIDPASYIEAKGNSLYRPILIDTQTKDTNKLTGYQLPKLDIGNQDVTFSNATLTFDHVPVVIVDDSFAFSELSVSKVESVGLDTAYNQIKGRMYKRTTSNTAENLISINLPSSGATAHAYSVSGELNVSWRRGPQSLTGSPSFAAERHSAEFVARNTGTVLTDSNQGSISTEGASVSSVTITPNTSGASVDIVVTGESGITVNEWLANIEFEYLR